MRNRLANCLVIGLLAAGAACSSSPPRVQMVSSADVPAARGSIKATRTDNGNTRLEIEVRYLAHPHRVDDGASTYVVWARQLGRDPQNLGALRVREDLTGSLSVVTPHQFFDVFITAERSASVQAPTGNRLLSASISTSGR